MKDFSNLVNPDYSTYIHKSRYARWREDLGRRENWGETVKRYCDFWEKRYSGVFPYSDIYNAIYNLEVVPSMRALMTAGEALERDNIAGFNCFAGDEKFLTSNGPKVFSECVDTEQLVLNQEGRWTKASIKSFGKQALTEVVLRPGRQSRTSVRHHIKVTPNHRWITERGETTSLQVGDIIPASVFKHNEECLEGFIAGFGFGDGTLDSRGRARVRLCGKKAQYLEKFVAYGHCSVMSPPSYHDDPLVVFHKGVFADWKKLPSLSNDSSYLSSWLSGFLAADGHSDPRQPGISSQSLEAISLVKEIAPYAGYVVTGHNVSTILETNYGTRKTALHRLTLREESEFKVMAITDLEVMDEVFCAVVPDTQTFTLANGVLTGNCSYIPIQDQRAFDEVMFILMNGTGVGYSVERQYVQKLPEVAETFHNTETVIQVADSKQGWAGAFRQLLSLLYSGQVPKWDTSRVRPSGARLKTFGGRASGPAPLEDLFAFTCELFKQAAGRKLTSVECSDLVCKTAEVVVVGGVRRSALICLSNLTDERMRNYKNGQWWVDDNQRALANISAAYTEKPDIGIFMKEWHALYESKSGERGIFNRVSARKQAEATGRRDTAHEFGTNPCGEIILRPFGFC